MRQNIIHHEWKASIENRSSFGETMGKNIMVCFWRTMYLLKYEVSPAESWEKSGRKLYRRSGNTVCLHPRRVLKEMDRPVPVLSSANIPCTHSWGKRRLAYVDSRLPWTCCFRVPETAYKRRFWLLVTNDRRRRFVRVSRQWKQVDETCGRRSPNCCSIALQLSLYVLIKRCHHYKVRCWCLVNRYNSSFLVPITSNVSRNLKKTVNWQR